MVGSTLRRFNDKARYVPMDFETESLSLAYSRPWQLAYAIADNKAIKMIKVEYLLWNDIAVSSEAARVTRFDKTRYLSLARPPKDVLAEFDAVVYDPSTEAIFQNGLGFDVYVHQTLRRLCGKPRDFSYLTRAIEMMALTKAVKLQLAPDVSSPTAFLAWQYRVHSHYQKGLKSSLEFCAREERIEHDFTSLHDAGSDIQLTMKLFWKRLFQIEF